MTLPCTSDVQRLPIHLYVQRYDPAEFINGYHKTRDLPSPHPEYANRTQVDHTQGTMKLWSIRPSDEGLYECHIGYPTTNDDKNIHLNVTGNITSVQTLLPCLCLIHFSVLFSYMWNIAFWMRGKSWFCQMCACNSPNHRYIH